MANRYRNGWGVGDMMGDALEMWLDAPRRILGRGQPREGFGLWDRDPGLPVRDWNRRSTDNLIEELETRKKMPVNELEELRAYEKREKNRSRLVDYLDQRIVQGGGAALAAGKQNAGDVTDAQFAVQLSKMDEGPLTILDASDDLPKGRKAMVAAALAWRRKHPLS